MIPKAGEEVHLFPQYQSRHRAHVPRGPVVAMDATWSRRSNGADGSFVNIPSYSNDMARLLEPTIVPANQDSNAPAGTASCTVAQTQRTNYLSWPRQTTKMLAPTLSRLLIAQTRMALARSRFLVSALRCCRRPSENDTINSVMTVFSSCKSILRSYPPLLHVRRDLNMAAAGPLSTGMNPKALGSPYDVRECLRLPRRALNLNLVAILIRPVRRTKIPAAS